MLISLFEKVKLRQVPLTGSHTRNKKQRSIILSLLIGSQISGLLETQVPGKLQI